MRTKNTRGRPRIFRSRLVAVFAALGMLLLSMGGVTLAASTASAVTDHCAGHDVLPKQEADDGNGEIGDSNIFVVFDGKTATFHSGSTTGDLVTINYCVKASNDTVRSGTGSSVTLTDHDISYAVFVGLPVQPTVDVSVSSETVCIGNEVTFTLKNTGSKTTTYVGQLTGPGINMPLGEFTLDAGKSQSRTDTPTVAGTYTVTFWVKGQDTIKDSASTVASDCSTPQVDVSVSTGTVCVGDEVTFTLKNTGSKTTTYVGQLTGPGINMPLGEFTLDAGKSQSRTDTPTVAGTYTVTFWVKGQDTIKDSASTVASDCADRDFRTRTDVDRDEDLNCLTETVTITMTRTTITEEKINGVWTFVSQTVGSPSVSTRDASPEELEVCPDDVELTEVSPAVAFQDADCDSLGASDYDLLATDGIDYMVEGRPGLGRTVRIVAVAEDGFVMAKDATVEFEHKFKGLKDLDCAEVLPTETTDVCPNMPGNQATVPGGRTMVDGECVKPDIAGTEDTDPTPGVVPTAVDAGIGGATPSSGSLATVMAQLMMGAGLLFLIAAGWLQRGRQNRGVHQF